MSGKYNFGFNTGFHEYNASSIFVANLKEIGLILTEIEPFLYMRFKKVRVSNGQFVYVQYA